MQLAFNRRGFVVSAGAALLSGCATVPRREACTPLPSVEIDPGRVLRAYACLRPYRESGFVVRRMQLGDKALVHNYGHGGAGITLSWGSSALATSLGLPGHSGAVAVLGAGVMGLTTARLAQEAGFSVTIYSAEVPPNTTSNLAGGQWGPTGHYREAAVTPEWRGQYRTALAISWQRFQALDPKRYGIDWLPTYTEAERVASPGLEPYYPGSRLLPRGAHPFRFDELAVYRTMYVETGRFMAQLTEDFLRAGGQVRIQRFSSPAEIAALPEALIFNCTGLGSRELFGDTELGPVRGQIVVLEPQPEVRYALTLPAGYMFPRADGIILGGTFEHGEWSTVPEPATLQRILSSHQRLFANLRCTA